MWLAVHLRNGPGYQGFVVNAINYANDGSTKKIACHRLQEKTGTACKTTGSSIDLKFETQSKLQKQTTGQC